MCFFCVSLVVLEFKIKYINIYQRYPGVSAPPRLYLPDVVRRSVTPIRQNRRLPRRAARWTAGCCHRSKTPQKRSVNVFISEQVYFKQ